MWQVNFDTCYSCKALRCHVTLNVSHPCIHIILFIIPPHQLFSSHLFTLALLEHFLQQSQPSTMSDRPHQVQVHPTQPSRHDIGGKGRQNGPSASQVLAVITLLPVSGTLLFLAGITLVGSLIGLAVTTPLFIIFSPVIIPAVITIGIAVTGFLSSGAFGLTGLSSLSWVLNYFRKTADHMPEHLDHAKKRAQDIIIYAGQKTKDVGQTMQNKAQEARREAERETGREGSRT